MSAEDYAQERKRRRMERRRKATGQERVPRIKGSRGRLRKLQAVELSEAELAAAKRWAVDR
jgi:hypothetical protein